MQTPLGPVPDELVRRSMAEAHDHLTSRMSRRRFLRAGAVGLGALVAGPVLWRQTAAASVPAEARHLAYGADPAREMAVSWMTPGPVARPVVEFGTDTSFGAVVEAETRTVVGTDTHYHHARLDGLDPETTYHYRVRHDGEESTDAEFRTAPAESERFVFTAFGDQGLGDAAEAITARVGEIRPAFHLHAGDISYANPFGLGVPDLDVTDPATWDDWLRMMSGVAATTPWMTSLGNHEMEPGYGPQGYDGYFGRFAMPEGDAVPAAYDFRYGNVAVVALDANDASSQLRSNRGYTDGEQDRWLGERLAAWRADPAIDFIVVHFHHCAYCTNTRHGSDGGVRDSWTGMFDEHEVDLVVNGHNHCYERTHPIRAGEPTRELGTGGEVRPAQHGTVYLTVGGGGRHLYEEFDTEAPIYNTFDGERIQAEPVEWSAARLLDHSLAAIEVTPAPEGGTATMKVRAITAAGHPIEAFTIARDRAPAATTAPPVVADPGDDPAAERDEGGGVPTLAVVGAGAAVVAAGTAAAVTHRRRAASTPG